MVSVGVWEWQLRGRGCATERFRPCRHVASSHAAHSLSFSLFEQDWGSLMGSLSPAGYGFRPFLKKFSSSFPQKCPPSPYAEQSHPRTTMALVLPAVPAVVAVEPSVLVLRRPPLSIASCNLRSGSLSRTLGNGSRPEPRFFSVNVPARRSLANEARKDAKPGFTVSARAENGRSSGKDPGGRFYFNVTGFPFPLGPFLTRKTFRTEVQKGRIWLFEQGQALGFSSVTTNTRMTVIKLESGGLWVHAPIGPTAECVQLLKELEAPVEFIVLPTFAYEHKIFVGPFSRAFPKAQVWVAPRQWSWPINLPLPLLGIFRAKVLKADNTQTPWAAEIEHKIISCPEVGIGPYVEVAFFHKSSKTLLVTDAVIFVPERPPKVVPKEALLAAAKNGLAVKALSAGKHVPNDPVADTAINRQRGWERMVLQILFLGPSDLLEPRQSFKQMSKKLIVSPIVKTLVYSKVPDKVRAWVTSITTDWNFKQIIPCHFAAPVAADARALKGAFAFIDPEAVENNNSLFPFIAGLFGQAPVVYPAADMKTLSSLDEFLVSTGAVRKTILGKEKP